MTSFMFFVVSLKTLNSWRNFVSYQKICPSMSRVHLSFFLRFFPVAVMGHFPINRWHGLRVIIPSKTFSIRRSGYRHIRLSTNKGGVKSGWSPHSLNLTEQLSISEPQNATIVLLRNVNARIPRLSS